MLLSRHHLHCLRRISLILLLGSPSLAPNLATASESITGCAILPSTNIWNTPIDNLPADPSSSAYIATIGATTHFHADFGSGLWDGAPIGIPYNVVAGTQTKVAVSFDYAEESDPGPYPVPQNPLIEGGPAGNGDRHILIVDRDQCLLYELYDAWPQANGTWHAGSGAIYDLGSQQLRPAGWTSADAAGLPILPGLVRYDEAVSDSINHAIRFTVPQTRAAWVWPGRHYASYLTAGQYPPMGQRFRLKAGYDITGFSPITQNILKAMKRYGIILADNGSAWFLSGVPDERWNNDILHELDRLQGSDMEAVNVSSLMRSSDSGEAGSVPTPATNRGWLPSTYLLLLPQPTTR